MKKNKKVTPIDYSKITVLEELQEFLNPLPHDQYLGLREKLEQYGILHPLLAARIGEQVVLLDGHNRQKWYEDRGKFLGSPPPEVHILDDVRSILDARVAMIEMQLARRNQSEQQVRVERGRLLQLRVQQERERGDGFVSTSSLSEEIAQQEKVSSRTVRRNKKLADAIDKIKVVDKTVARKIESDQLPLTVADILAIAAGDTQACVENIRAGRKWDDSGEPLVQATATAKKKKSSKEKKLSRLIQRFATCIETLIPQLKTELINIDRGLNVSGKSKHRWPDSWDENLESIYGQLISWKPVGPCPDCQLAGCKRCNSRGWLRRKS